MVEAMITRGLLIRWTIPFCNKSSFFRHSFIQIIQPEQEYLLWWFAHPPFLSRAVLFPPLSATQPLLLTMDFICEWYPKHRLARLTIFFGKKRFFTVHKLSVSAFCKRNYKNTVKGCARLILDLLCHQMFFFKRKIQNYLLSPPFALKTLAITLRARLPLVELYCSVATDGVRRRGGLSGFSFYAVELDERHKEGKGKNICDMDWAVEVLLWRKEESVRYNVSSDHVLVNCSNLLQRIQKLI